jgi:hypothetical protein
MDAVALVFTTTLAGAALFGAFWWGVIWERGHYEQPPCPRRHPDELRGGLDAV